MNREQLSEIIGGIDARHVAEAFRYDPAAAHSPERTESMKTKRILALALAAALLLSLSIAACAAYSAVGTPQAAEKVAREQIEVWKELGLLSPEVEFVGDATRVLEFEESDGGDYWYGRLFPHRYDVRWYGAGKYSCNLSVDTLTGKLLYGDIEAAADEGRNPVREETIEMEEGHPETWYFYDNFEDIFPADMTVDRFCTLLAEYWGFTGYRIADTDDDFYREHWDAVDGSTLLKDLSSDTRANYYLTVFFEGDQEGAPMYLQLAQFPGRVSLMLGTGHAVG